MRYLSISSTRKNLLLCLSLSILASSFSFADDGDEIIQELKQNCESLAKNMEKSDKKFLSIQVNNIRGLVVWRSSRCEKPPKGEGIITALCEGDLASGAGVLFWQHKTKTGKLQNGFLTCE
jgi:hypothetical protein